MRSTLHFILTLRFLSFLESAITKFEGENVTFQPNITGLQINSYSWNFTQNNLTEKIIHVTKEGTTIQRTRFKGRLDTDNKTGSITILHLTLYDAGTFHGLFFRNRENVSYHIVELEVKEGNDYITLTFPVGFNVTLSSTLQRREEDHVISWFFSKLFTPIEIANSKKHYNHHGDIFNNLFLNLTNGDLTIPQITKSVSGIYYFRIWKHGNPYLSGIYDVRVYDGNDYITLNFPVGFNVTLSSTLQRREEDHVISWLFGKLFLEREIANSRTCPRKHGDIFDNVFLNPTNGDLKIPQITKSFCGKYHFRIRKHGNPCSSGIYNVRVYDQVSVPNISKSTDPPTNGSCRVTCSVENGPEVYLTWFRGNISISHSSSQNDSTLRLPLHIRSEDFSTYSCQAQNPVSEKRTTLDSQQLTCHNAGSASLSVIVVSVVVPLVIIGVGICLFILWKKWSRGRHVRDPQRSQSNQQTSPQTADSSSLTSEEFLLQSCQGPSYDTVN